MTLLTKASIGCELVAVLFALGALALLYLKARTHTPPRACTLHTPCTLTPAPCTHHARIHTAHPPPTQASTLKPALGVIIDELANLKNSTGHGRDAYDNLGKELDLLQVTSA